MKKIERVAEIDALCPKLDLDFKKPDHTKELEKAKSIIGDIQSRVKEILNPNNCFCLTENNYSTLTEEIIDMLDYVGNLSMWVFKVEFDIEDAYINAYGKSQETKIAWYNHYIELHLPYSEQKNKCFRLLDDLDDEYIEKLGKFPPNYVKKFDEVV